MPASRAVFARAVKAGLISTNPALLVDKPRRLVSRRRALDQAELNDLWAAVAATTPDPDLDLLSRRSDGWRTVEIGVSSDYINGLISQPEADIGAPRRRKPARAEPVVDVPTTSPIMGDDAVLSAMLVEHGAVPGRAAWVSGRMIGADLAEMRGRPKVKVVEVRNGARARRVAGRCRSRPYVLEPTSDSVYSTERLRLVEPRSSDG